MAGEIQEPFRLNFQADLLHSGSISFGRFESESLSWERRSIFSHNRYLEEVEKYSKPGTVTEKKAYFEAEFKRKALLKQRASECQDVGESPTRRNTDLHDFEESGNCKDSSSGSDPSVCNRETEIQQYEQKDVRAFYTENSNGSTHNSEYDEDTRSQVCDEPVKNMVDCPVSIPEHFKFDVTRQSEAGNVVENNEQSIGETLIEKVVVVDVASKSNDLSLSCKTQNKRNDIHISGTRTMVSTKVKPALEKKLTRVTPKTQDNVDRFQKHRSYEVSKGSMKPRTTEAKYLPVKKTEKKSPRPASPFTSSAIKTSKSVDATSLKEKQLRLEKSIVKDLKSEKTVKTRFPISETSLPGVRPTINRPKQSISSSKPHTIQSSAGFSLKTDLQAENRKEICMKIMRKTPAKEVKVNQVEAKTLEKQAAQMNQFRRSLNFKATPMPSFYNNSARVSDQHKVTQNQPRPSSQSMATRRDKNALNTKSSVPLNIRPSSSNSSTNRHRLSESARRNPTPEKKEQEKKNSTSLTKQNEPVKKQVKGTGLKSGRLVDC